jgi:oxygen-dependent protoporphyrinogen oxidase
VDGLLDFAGLRDEVVKPQPPMTRWVHLDGQVLKAPGLALLARAGVGRALLEPLFAKPLREDMPLRAFLVERLGRKAGSLAASVMAAGVYAGDPDRLSARDAFPMLGERAQKGSLFRGPRRARTGLWNLRRGLGSLPLALAGKLQVRLRTPVERLEPGWSVQGEPFDAVVLAVPASRAAVLTRPFAPHFAEALREFTTAAVTLVHLGFAQETVPRGFGMIDADFALTGIGTLLPSSMLPGRAPPGKALLCAICGGARHPERAQLADGELVARVVADLRQTLGVAGEPEYVRVVRQPEAIPQYAPGHRERVKAARALLARFPRLELAGAAYDGVSVPDVAASGAAAAERLLGRV